MKPKLETKINNTNYSPGGLIKGTLSLYNFQVVGIKYLQLLLIGEIHNNFNLNQIIDFDELHNILDICYYYDFINNKFISENKRINFLLEPLYKNIDFNILIPEYNLPSTHKCKNFTIKYKLLFKLNYIDISTNKNKEVYLENIFNIIPYIYTFDDNYINPLIINKDFFSIFLPYQSYIPGDIIPLEINIKKIQYNEIKIKLSLEKKIIFTNFLDLISDKENMINYNKKITIKKYNNIVKIMDFQIPYNCNYSIFSETTKHIFELKYFFIVKIYICKKLSEKIIIPIIIGSYRYNSKNIEKIPFLPKYTLE